MKLSDIISGYTNSIAGGAGDKTDPASLNKQELAVGIYVELEHTNNVMTACDIACDHLTETPDYYSALIKCGLADEPKALKLAKKFNWQLVNEDAHTRELETPRELQIQAASRVARLKTHLAKGAKIEAGKYKGAVRALRSIIKHQQINPSDKKDLIKVTTDLLWRAGVFAILVGFTGIAIGVVQSLLSSTAKHAIQNALTESTNDISDDELMQNYIELVAKTLLIIPTDKIK